MLIDKFETEGRLRRIFATILVERDTHKAMIIGQKGAKLKQISTEGAPRHGEARSTARSISKPSIKVKSGWADNEAGLRAPMGTNDARMTAECRHARRLDDRRAADAGAGEPARRPTTKPRRSRPRKSAAPSRRYRRRAARRRRKAARCARVRIPDRGAARVRSAQLSVSRDESRSSTCSRATHGRLALVAKGAKRPHSALRGVLQTFQPLGACRGPGKCEVRTLTGGRMGRRHAALTGDALLCGFYVNELLVKFCAREDPHPQLFNHYVVTMTRLAHDEPPVQVLRSFERVLLRETGYAMALDRTVTRQAGRWPTGRYVFDPERGVREASDDCPSQWPGGRGPDLARHGTGRLPAARRPWRKAKR